jgi:hypothetical protein
MLNLVSCKNQRVTLFFKIRSIRVIRGPFY